jgi:UPF0755 protein
MFIKLFNKYINLTKNELYFVLTVFLFIGSLLAFTFYGPNYNNYSSTVILDIPKGASFNSILDEMFEKGIIKSKFNLKATALLLGLEKKIKAGRYEIPDGISYVKLLSLLNKGVPKKQKLVTIHEGIWQTELAKLLNKELGINEQELLSLSVNEEFIKELGLSVTNLEGYLLPETYYFFEGLTVKEVLKKLSAEMLFLFEEEETIEKMKVLKMDMHKILIMASIIDGESNIISEFKKIAGVYYNRLRNGWKLQADPTVQYLVRQKREKVNKIYYKDLEIDSRYNTYKYYGLPPSPINNPGRAAIMAALNPEKHGYYYFVADGNGGHVFSKTLREHQNNVNRYRTWRRNNNN